MSRSQSFSPIPSEDMKGSDSNQQHAVVHSNPYQQDSQRYQSQMQRAQPGIDARVPQYLTPGVGSRRLVSPATLPGSQRVSLPTSTVPPTTTTSPPTTTVAADIDRVNSTSNEMGESPADVSSSEESSGPSIQASHPASVDQSSIMKAGDYEGDSPSIGDKSSSMKPDEPEASIERRQELSEQSSEQANRPSVQGNDETNEAAPDSAVPRAQDSEQMTAAGSSIKSVEVEIPSNSDEQSQTPNRPEPINHVGTVSFNSNGLGFPDIPNASYEPSIGSPQLTQYQHQPIQPRESAQVSTPVNAERRAEKARDEGHIDDLMLVSSGLKTQFGARSVPANQKSLDNGQESQPAPSGVQFANHQTSGLIPASAGNSMESVNPSDRVLMDRSDDASGNEPISQSDGQGTKPVKPETSIETRSGDESLDLDGGRVVKPVVGTDELASGSVHLEDRIGSAVPKDNLEDELIKLQRQIPQSAALVSSSNQQDALPIIQNQSSVQPAEEVKPSERLDSAQLNGKPLTSSLTAPFVGFQRDFRQVHPNVLGQAKVLPDPSSQLNSRGQMLTQASNQEPVFEGSVVVPANQMQVNKQPQVIDPSKPIAQITNIPMNVGFPQGQIPSMQQISQHFAYLQQQQQQQQQQQSQQQIRDAAGKQTNPTPKPSRIRFNLLSPQAALHAVASRILPKSFISSQNQQQDQMKPQQSPQLLSNPKLYQQMSQAQPQAQLQQQQFGQQAQFGAANPSRQPGGPLGNFAQNTPIPSLQQQNQAPQQLFRSRRSAIEPTGKRGNGEIGIKKSFMVVTGVDLAFSPNSSDAELPPILEGRSSNEEADDVIYGVCMPVVSLTFILTCFFWLVVFLFTFCIYMIVKARCQRRLLATPLSQKEAAACGY